MPGDFLETITSDDSPTRDRSLDSLCRGASAADLLSACGQLDRFRRTSTNLYDRVRALFFLSSIHRYHLPERLPAGKLGRIRTGDTCIS